MLLSKPAILRHLKKGTIVIDPYKENNMGNCSYDVSLGEWYFRESHPEGGFTTYNPYSQKEVRKVWGTPQRAERAKKWMEKHNVTEFECIDENDLIIWIAPGETILCHTSEFIGGRESVTTMMKARSSMGRNFLEICKCAGWGDIGYINRWTMEATNNSRFYQIPLVVGRRLAQIVFFEAEKVEEEQDYSKQGKYQSTVDIDTLKKDWSPELMLPRLSKDKELKKEA